MSKGRPLDKANWLFHMEDGPAAAVVEALAAFQNDDGGFGHGLEPDSRTPASSAVATTVAFQVLRGLPAGQGEGLARKATGWLLDSRCANGGWSLVPPEVEGAPHAPWWTHAPAPDPSADAAGWANPGLEVAGILHLWPTGVADSVREEVSATAESVLGSLPDPMEMHSLLCALRFLDYAAAEAADGVRGKVEATCLALIPEDPAKWTGYGPRPLWYAPAPQSPAARVLRGRVEDHLDVVVGEQSEEGAWNPVWTWGQDEDNWAVARRDWQGWLTVNTAVSLQAWGRLEAS